MAGSTTGTCGAGRIAGYEKILKILFRRELTGIFYVDKFGRMFGRTRCLDKLQRK